MVISTQGAIVTLVFIFLENMLCSALYINPGAPHSHWNNIFEKSVFWKLCEGSDSPNLHRLRR